MSNILKKLFTNHKRSRVFLAFLYLFATFGILANHTCQSSDNDINQCYLECSSDLLHSDNSVKVQHTGDFNQNSLSYKIDSHELNCSACIFLLTTKVFKLYPKTSLCSTLTVIRTQISRHSSFAKQLEWFCSASLRAPPIITS